jgi:hypothetical protein
LVGRGRETNPLVLSAERISPNIVCRVAQRYTRTRREMAFRAPSLLRLATVAS